MKKIFEKTTIGGIPSKNRIVRSATQEGLAVDGGHIGQELRSVYQTLSEGGAGIIITGMVGVDENSRVFPLMVKAYDDQFVQGMHEIVESSHSNDCKIVVQIAHNGVTANPDSGNPPLGPSERPLGEKTAKGMTQDEIKDVANSFASTALRCKEAGADGVQIHCAHGYLLSQFLSPVFNQRSDEYGGDISNRARIVFDTYDAVRSAVGNDYPIWVKINSSDFVEGGLSAEESLWVCKELDNRRINGIEVSGGLAISPESAPTRISADQSGGTFSEYALSVAENVNASVISVGGYRIPEEIEQLLNKGQVDAVSIGRPLICEPDLPNKWEQDDSHKPKCISCNKCFDYSSGFGCKVFSA